VAATVKISDFETGDIVYIDVLDGELGTEVTFDNDAPPNADWVTFLGGDPILISCYGEKTTTNSLGESPGPFVSIAKRQNRDAFPDALATPLSPPDTIIGFVASVGRLFLLTRIGLPFASSTGQSDFPVTTRAFWQTGFESPFGLVFVNDTLYGFTSKGITRSIATGDEGSEQFAFASFVEDITRDWYAGHVHAVHDPQNELVVFIYSAAYKNDDGFWVSLALPLYLRYGFFGPLITIEKPDRDMVVCGAAKVEGHLQFLAGGRGAIDVFSSEESSEEPSEETPPTEPVPYQWLRPEEIMSAGLSSRDHIQLWDDHSGNNRDGTGSSSAGPFYTPGELDGFAAARFEGDNVLRLLPSQPWRGTADGVECMIVVKMDADPQASAAKSGLWDFQDQNLANHFTYLDRHIYENAFTTNRYDLGNAPGSLAVGYHLYNLKANMSEFRAFMDGAQFFLSATNSTMAPNQAMNIGYSGSPTFTLFIPKMWGNFVEWIIWNTTLTDPQRADWWTYFKDKYPSIPMP
jgi:hypothetical protein